jgi:hypothetical protein
MSKSNTFETELLNLIFNNTNIANIGDATGLRGSSAVGNLHIALHSADPGEAGDQTTSELSYSGYARVAVARGQFTVANNQVSNTNEIAFPASGNGPQTALWYTIGTSASGAGKVLYRGLITTPSGGLIINSGTAPKFAPGMAAVTED